MVDWGTLGPGGVMSLSRPLVLLLLLLQLPAAGALGQAVPEGAAL